MSVPAREFTDAPSARGTTKPDAEALDAAARVGECLHEMAYNEANVTAAAHRTPYAALEPGDAALADYLLDLKDPLGCAIELLLLGRTVGADRALRLLGAQLLDDLALLGLITGDRDVHSLVSVVPFEDLILVGDRPAPDVDGTDRFVSVSPSSVTVARLAPQRAARALDLGTGCGILALQAARSGAAAVGTDLSTQALRFAAMNGALNGADGVDWRRGDWLDAVDPNEQFDVVTANLPFVLAPSRRDGYSDAGSEGDIVTRTLASALAAFLTPNGTAVLLGTWALRAGEEWPDVLIDGSTQVPSSVLAIELATHDPLSYAIEWNDRLRRIDGESFAAVLRTWLEHHQALGIERLVTAAVVARRRNGAESSLVTLEAPTMPGPRGAQQVGRILDMLDLGLNDPDAVLGATVVAAPGLVLHQRLTDRGSKPLTAVEATASVAGGLSVVLPLSPANVAVLCACDGERSLARAASIVARQTGMDEARLAHEAGYAALDLLRCGLVTLHDAGDGPR